MKAPPDETAKSLASVVVWVLILALAAVASASPPLPEPAGDRLAILHDLTRKTLEREAFSQAKIERYGLDFERSAHRLAPEFRAADTELALWRALRKLSNLRQDWHLQLLRTRSGFQIEERMLEAPVRFAPDFSNANAPGFFVADLARRQYEKEAVETATVDRGDRLLGVNGEPMARYLERLRPNLRFSTADGMAWDAARVLSKKLATFDPALYGETLRLDLEDRRGRRYPVSLSYEEADDLVWEYPYVGPRPGYPRRFPGFERVMDLESFSVLRFSGEGRVLLIVLHTFYGDFTRDVDAFMARAVELDLLKHDVVVDATHSDGGHDSPYLLRRLAARPFRITRSNVRISDVTPQFVEWMREDPDPNPRLLAWFESEVMQAYREGRAYSPDVPYQLRYEVDAATGELAPAPAHFEGRLAFLFGSMAGSQVDQLAAMVIDNRLGHSIGMPTGGYSNFWHWRETVTFPSSSRPIAGFEWSIGKTLRPNGEELEGNPPMVDEYIPFGRDNYTDYYDLLLARAVGHLAAGRD